MGVDRLSGRIGRSVQHSYLSRRQPLFWRAPDGTPRQLLRLDAGQYPSYLKQLPRPWPAWMQASSTQPPDPVSFYPTEFEAQIGSQFGSYIERYIKRDLRPESGART